ncbi:hypothetical protein A2165_03520 [Candidatus Curtissbacteria bacterium RBG_13_40_7]|uniref:Glycosyltransferase RgtA/B/C/D-like domain-containing protein n=1 Tax=Candidatus Curtissbacteria bacterium RBG_13_40_7 TaxID=1797706 RepID=A0A1F5FUU3_9BACT|nr:MAG: hypothetical protein A2165_03520 [Candidatus Curtissbacteria bacterium RBG_13_40_7]
MKKVLLFYLLSLFFITFFSTNLFSSYAFIFGAYNDYVYLANSLIHGNLSLENLPYSLIDISIYKGRYFWPLGPFPSILITPFVFIFGLAFKEWILKFLLTILSFLIVIKISKAKKLSAAKSYALAFFFIFGSVYTPIAALAISSYFSQVVGCFCILLAIYEFITNKRWFLIGILISFATLTRIELLLSSLFFLIFLFKKPLDLKKLLYFSVPIIMSLSILGSYNFVRFDNVLESGLTYIIDVNETKINKKFGLFSLKYIPTNLYYMLIKTPDPVNLDESHILKPPYLKTDYYGLSLFFLSPVLFLMFRLNLKDEETKIILFTIFLMALPLVLFYGIGYLQIGYRYAVGSLPFISLILIKTVKNISSRTLNILVGIGVITTWFFIIQILSGF